MIRRILNIISFFTIVIAFGMIILFGFWKLYPYKVMDVKNTHYPILNENKTVQQGGRLVYQVDACKYVDITPDLKKFFVVQGIHLLQFSILQ